MIEVGEEKRQQEGDNFEDIRLQQRDRSACDDDIHEIGCACGEGKAEEGLLFIRETKLRYAISISDARPRTSFARSTHTLFLDLGALSSERRATHLKNARTANSTRTVDRTTPSSKQGVRSNGRSCDTGPQASLVSRQVREPAICVGNKHEGDGGDGASRSRPLSIYVTSAAYSEISEIPPAPGASRRDASGHQSVRLLPRNTRRGRCSWTVIAVWFKVRAMPTFS